MSDAFMTYYENVTKLSIIANKQTMFLNHMLYLMEFNHEYKMCVTHLNFARKKEILGKIGASQKDVSRNASIYLSALQKAGLVLSVGGGMYLMDPSSYSYGKYIPSQLRGRAAKIFENRVYTDKAVEIIETSVMLDTGEIIDCDEYISRGYS